MIDKYFEKNFDLKNYNCWDFIRDVWLDMTGTDIGKRTPSPPTRAAMKLRFANEEGEFLKLDKPESPCLVLMKRNKMLPHVGVYFLGKMLHLHEKHGVQYQPLSVATLGFKEVGFYKCKE